MDERPRPDTVMNALDNAGNAVELRRKELTEADLGCFLSGCRDEPNGDIKKAKARWFADVLDSVRQFGNQVSRVT